MPFAGAEELFDSKSLFQTKRQNEWPLALCCTYFDESQEKPCLAIAGYSAAIDTWWDLDCQWQALLKKWNLKYFKASECENGQLEFAQYRDDLTAANSPLNAHERERLRKIKIEFVDAICQRHHVLQGYGAALVTQHFDRTFAEDAMSPVIFLDKPHYIGAHLCLVAAAMLVRDVNTRRSGNDKIEVRPLLCTQEEYGGIGKNVFNDFAAKNPSFAEVLLPPHYDDDHTNSWLQVADTLAYEIRKQLIEKTDNPSDDYMRVPLRRLLPAIHRVFRLDCKNLNQVILNYSPDSIPIQHLLPMELWQE